MDIQPTPEPAGTSDQSVRWPLTPEMIARAAEEDETRRRAAAERARQRQQHVIQERAQRRAQLQAALHEETPDAGASERILADLAAHEAVLAERLGALQLALADRAEATVDNARFTLALCRALREVTMVRSLSTRRAQELLQAAANLRVQRRFVGVRGLA